MGSSLFFMSQDRTASLASEAAYKAESDLQQIVAANPQLLMRAPSSTGESLMLVRQEYPVRDPDDDSIFYSLDHLFLDQDGVPVLVEVKRSSDARIRREVVGQMLDYASRARYWDLSEIQQCFRLANPESPYDTEDFWGRVSSNLKAERMKLVFVADKIPDTLSTLIDFLSRNIDGMEIYGVEVRQYHSGGGTLLTSTTIGGAATAQEKLQSNIAWDADRLLQQFSERGRADLAGVSRSLMDFGASLGLRTAFGRGPRYGAYYACLDDVKVFGINSWDNAHDGLKGVVVVSLSPILDALDGTMQRVELRQLLSSFPAATADERKSYISEPANYEYIDLRLLLDGANMEYFQSSITQLVEKLKEATP